MMDTAQKVLYAAVGAPVLAGKRTVEIGRKLAGTTRDTVADIRRNVAETARKEYTAAADEGEQVANRVRKSNVVEEISSRLDLDDIQGRVDRLRDQFEDAIQNWREQFRPEVREETATMTETAKVTAAPKTSTPEAAPKKAAPKAAAKKKTTTKAAAKKKTTTTKKATTSKSSSSKS